MNRWENLAGEAVVMIPFTLDMLESMEGRWSPPVRWRSERDSQGEWSVVVRGVDVVREAGDG